MLDHWMKIELGEDYYSAFRHRAPEGLVSEPPNDPVCTATMRRLTSVANPARRGLPSSAPQVKRKCEQLNEAVKTQTLTFLVATDWLIDFTGSHGVRVSAAEVAQMLKRLEAQPRTRPGKSLESGRQVIGKQVYLAEVEALKERLARQIQAEGSGAKLAREASRLANTVACLPGYVVAHCRQFKAPAYTGPSVSALLREIAR
jgi:hypothetical protein